MNSAVDDIKSRLDIVDVLSSYIRLDKAGHNYKALCPFHNEKTPSFVIFPNTQTWRCFGACGEGGDIFSFVMKFERVEFREALKILADRAGVVLDTFTPQTREKDAYQARLHELLDNVATFYMELLLKSNEAAATRAYVESRGLTPETVQHFKIGFAPNQWNTVLDEFRMLGYSQDELMVVGLLSENDQGRVYDRFRHRLMIPIRDGQGHTVGFGARALQSDQNPKYLNSPQSDLFDKSQLLYGLDMARRSIRESETAVVVEGYMDVIQAHQAGYTNVVAQMGTALTPAQTQLIAKYAKRVVLALDSDTAGVNATMRGLNVVRENLSAKQGFFDPSNTLVQGEKLQLDMHVLRLPSGKDPDDFIRSHPDEWPGLVENAMSLVDYVIAIGTRGLKPNAEIFEREKVARELLPLLTASENDLQSRRNVQRLALRLRITEKDLLRWANKTQATIQAVPPKQRQDRQVPPPKAPTPVPPAKINGGLAVERYCLAVLLHQPRWLYDARRKLRELGQQDAGAIEVLYPMEADDFSREDYRVVFRFIEAALRQDDLEPEDYIEQNSPTEISMLIKELGRLISVQDQLSPILSIELKSIADDYRGLQHLGYPNLRLNEFLHRVLTLRMERLKREETDYYFLLKESQQNGTDVEMEALVQTRVKAYTSARRLLKLGMTALAERR